MHILVIENFQKAQKKLLETNNTISWMTEVDSIENEKGYFYKIGIHPDASSKEWIRWASHLNSIRKIDKVVNFHEHRQEEAALIAEHLGLEYCNSLETIKVVNNKKLMRNKLKNEGFEEVENTLANSIDDIKEFLQNIKGPIIAKPVNGRGSTDIKILKTESDISNLKDYSCLYLEEYLDGPEYSIEAFSTEGKHEVYAITKKYKDENSFVEYCHSIPAPLTAKQENTIKVYVQKILTVLNVQNGATHTEVILTKRGPRIIETHLRLAGDRITEMVELVYGVNLIEHWINKIIGKVHFPQSSEQKYQYATVFLKHNEKTGIVKEIINDYKADQNTRKISIYKKVGDKIEPTKSSSDRLASVVVTSDTAEEGFIQAKSIIDQIIYKV